MSKWSISLLCLAGLIAASPMLHAQALPTATRPGGGIQVGVGVSLIQPDYDYRSIKGFTIYGDYDITRQWSAEVDVHLGNVITPGDIAMNSYYVGPRYTYRRNKLGIYGRIMVGRESITDQAYGQSYNNKPYFGQSASFNTYAFAGGVEYRIKRHYNLRADAEMQKIPDFEPHTLTPMVYTIGVAYIIR